MNPVCEQEKHPSPCACCEWRLTVELPALRSTLAQKEDELAGWVAEGKRLQSVESDYQKEYARAEQAEAERDALKADKAEWQNTAEHTRLAMGVEIDALKAENAELKATAALVAESLNYSLAAVREELEGWKREASRQAEKIGSQSKTIEALARALKEARSMLNFLAGEYVHKSSGKPITFSPDGVMLVINTALASLPAKEAK